MDNINQEIAYLDNGDSTPMLQEVVDEMTPYFTQYYGNPASLHGLGLQAEEAIDESRARLAATLGANPREMIFTSGATEANNLALNGLRLKFPEKRHVVTSPVEHASNRNVVKRWQKAGWLEWTELTVDDKGFVDPDSLRDAIRDDTLLVSIIHGNNEIGTIQDLDQLGEICHEKGTLLHSDMAQSFGKVPLDMGSFPVDIASFNVHKMHGPKGIGALYIRSKLKIQRYFEGSPQEHGVRPGTENVPGIVGFAKAAEIATSQMEDSMEHVNKLSKKLADGLLSLEHVRWNGADMGPDRLPGNINVTFSYIEGEAILMHMNLKGVCVSSGSACSSSSLEPSHVLKAIGLVHEEAHGSIRYTLSRLNTEQDVDKALEVTKATVDQLRAMTAFIPEQHSERESKDAQTFYKEK